MDDTDTAREEVRSDILAGGGEMGALMRAYDWENSPLGPPETWPQSLRLTIKLILSTRHPMFVWWGPDLIQFYNDAYARTMGPEKHPAALGNTGRETWAEIWDIIGPQIDYVLAGKGSTWDENRLVPVTRHGSRQDVWWTYSYCPIDAEGEIGGVLVICSDVTATHLASEALKDRTRYLERLFEQAPGFMAVLRGPDHVFEFTNAAFRRLVGDRDLLGRPTREVVPEAEGQGFFELLDQAYSSGEAQVRSRMPLTFQAGSGGPTRETFLDFVYQPILGIDGRVSGIFVEGADVTDHVGAEEHLRFMNAELMHRGKNMLAIVRAIASQTLPDTQDVDAFKDRLLAFDKAHDILTATSLAQATVRDLIEGALAPYRTGRGRFSIGGPRIVMASRQALLLSLAVHELATNATKHGALSDACGRVRVAWREDMVEGEAVFALLWQETGGPPVEQPSSRGFGTTLLERALVADFGGRIEITYDPGGLICRFTASMANILAAAGPPVASSDGRRKLRRG